MTSKHKKKQVKAHTQRRRLMQFDKEKKDTK